MTYLRFYLRDPEKSPSNLIVCSLLQGLTFQKFHKNAPQKITDRQTERKTLANTQPYFAKVKMISLLQQKHKNTTICIIFFRSITAYKFVHFVERLR